MRLEQFLEGSKDSVNTAVLCDIQGHQHADLFKQTYYFPRPELLEMWFPK